VYDSGRARSNLLKFAPMFVLQNNLYMLDWSSRSDYKIHKYSGSGSLVEVFPSNDAI